MSLYLRLAWRNLWRHRRRTFIVIVSIACVLALMMLYDGLIAGFEQAIYSNAIKVLGGNIQVHAAGYHEKADKTPLLPLPDEAAILTELPVSLVAQNVSAGRYLTAEDQDVVFIGKGLADAMGLAVGDRFTLTGQATHQQMRQRTMTVAGVYDVGMRDIEKRTLYISLTEAEDLYGLPGASTEVVISLQKLGQEPAVLAALRSAFPGYEIDSWQTNFPELASAISTKGGVMNVFSVIIMLIAGIGIFNLLMMAVYERTREIGLLGAMGLKPGEISLLFILEGTLMGLVGVAIGVVLGLVINATMGRVGFDYSQFSTLTEYTALISGRVYPTLGVNKLLGRALTVAVIAALSALYPAREAARREPAEALHFV
ncbi:MAG: FtsX-like permease family protein [Anaerolineales bacterium]